jgi:hypothetical protein
VSKLPHVQALSTFHGRERIDDPYQHGPGSEPDWRDPNFPRGETQVGHKGFVAWIDDHTRQVHVAKGKCIQKSGRGVDIAVEHSAVSSVTVPHGRLQWSPKAALEALADDIREEGERMIAEEQATVARIQKRMLDLSRGMMFHLIAVEIAKAATGQVDAGAKFIEYTGAVQP